MDKLTIGMHTGEHHGTCYYRGTLVKRGIDKIDKDAGISAFFSHTFNPAAFRAVDVAYFLRPAPEAVPIERIHSLKREGVGIVVDADDLIFDVPLWSPAHQTFAQHDIIEYYKSVYMCADVITFTTHRLSQEFTKLNIGLNSNRVIIPNAIDDSLKIFLPNINRRLKDNEKPNIGWAGGAQHQGDHAAMEKVYKAFLKKGWGLTFQGDFARQISGMRFTRFAAGTHNVEQYYQALAFLEFDVAIAPCLPITFNHCKSDIKITEYFNFCGCPVLASTIDPYLKYPYEGDINKQYKLISGFEPDMWVHAAEKAISYMKEHGTNFFLLNSRRLSATMPLWIQAFEAARERAKS